jgi:diguanylate cyclase (GGDEF)-like protein
MDRGLNELAAVAQRFLPDVLPIDQQTSLAVLVHTADEGLLSFSADDDFSGVPTVEPTLSATQLALPIPGDGPRAEVLITLTGPADLPGELSDMFARLGPLLRVALNRHLDQRAIEHQQAELQQTASHDALTGLYNRHVLATHATLDGNYGLLMIDIDHFKSINDRYGHTIGDLVLQSVAATVVTSVRRHDSVIRYGGEEILVILPSTDETTTQSIADRIRSHIERLRFDAIPDLHVTVSIGATIHRRMRDVDQTIAEADRTLYAAKEAGRNQVRTSW